MMRTANLYFGLERNGSLRDVNSMNILKSFILYSFFKSCIFRKGRLAMMAYLWYNEPLRATLVF